MSAFRLGDRVPDFGAAVGAFIDEVDPGHAPIRFDISHIHGEQTYAAWADDCSGLDLVMLDVSWHVGSPSAEARSISTPSQPNRGSQIPIINSSERKKNARTIFLGVAFT
jgi:hypothetical protein